VSFRPREETVPPEARQITDVAVMRFEHIYEVDPKLMQEHVRQQPFPNWDTLRVAHSRHDHLAWMHTHWATVVVSGDALLRELDAETGPAD